MKKFLLALVALVGMTALADVPNPDFGFLFNRLPGEPLARKYHLGTKIREAHNTAVCVYDFATSGGGSAAGTINLLSTDLVTPCLLPGKAIVRNGFFDVSTGVTMGASGKFSISSGAVTADLFALSDSSVYAVGRKVLSPSFATASTYIKLANANSIVNGVSVNAYQPRLNVSTASITAGHFRVFIDYSLGE